LLKRIWYSIFAARKLDKAVQADPNNVTARTIRAFTALVLPGFLRRLQTAVDDFEYLIKIKCEDPSRLPDEMMPKVYLNLGLAYAKLRDRERAKQILTFVVDSYPGTGEHNRAKSLLGKLADRGW
jgi:Tfp pilus assembly protein PilF